GPARNQTLVGPAALHSIDDVERLSGRRAITGGLVVESQALLALRIPELRTIGGTLRVVRSPQLERLAFASLERLGGDLVVDNNPRLLGLPELPALRDVGGAVVVT